MKNLVYILTKNANVYLHSPLQRSYLTLSPGLVFIKHLKSNVYVTLNDIGSF